MWSFILLLTVIGGPFQEQSKNPPGTGADDHQRISLFGIQRLSIKWGTPFRSTAFGQYVLRIPIKVLATNPDGSNREFDFPLKVEVIMAREPDKQLDFCHPFTNEEVVRGYVEYNNINRFGYDHNKAQWHAEIPIGALKLPIGKEASFQAFVYYPSFFAFNTEAKGKFNAIYKNSVTKLTVKGPDRMNEILVAINHCPTIFDTPFNPTNIVKAVNPLIRVGKDQAIQELQKYHSIAGHQISRTYIRPENSDTATRWCIVTIAETLFENYLTKPQDDSDRNIMVHDGIPFLVTRNSFFGDPDRDWTRLLNRMKREGKMLSKELVPSSNPMRSAEALFKQIKLPEPAGNSASKSWNQILRYMLHEQAWLMVKTHFPEVVDSRWNEKAFSDRLKQIDAKKLKWNLERNEYEVMGK